MCGVIVLTDEVSSTAEALILLGLTAAYWIFHIAGSVLLYQRLTDWLVGEIAHIIPVLTFAYVLVADLATNA